VASSNAGVARRVWRWTTDEFLKKGDQKATIPVDALEQAAFLGLHRLLQQFLPIGMGKVHNPLRMMIDHDR
jgi:hypothetical protein